MSVPGGIVQAQTDALLRRVAREQEMLSRRARDAAAEQADAIVARARAEAGARGRQAAAEARSAVERALADRRAALETAARQREQALLRGLLDSAWGALPAALGVVWAERAARERWCEAAGELARRTLTGTGALVVEVDASHLAEVAQAIAARLRAADGTVVEMRGVAGLGPGLRVRRGLACLDATVPGLMASRERVEADLLAEFDALLEQRRGTAP
jgi:hypothetical protein